MKKQISKTKLISAVSAAAATIGLATPLATLSSCAKSGPTYMWGSEFDKEYGIGKATCIALADDFQTQAFDKIDHGMEEPEVKAAMKNRVLSTLESFKSMYTGSNRKMSYTAVSNTMILYADRAYGISLKRNINANWNIIRTMYSGAVQSAVIYMDNNGFGPKERDALIKTADDKFKTIFDSLRAKYKDPVLALTDARTQIIRCFAGMSDDITLMAAHQEMVNFFDNYTVEFNYDNENNYLDKLVKMDGFVENADISKFANQLFIIKDRQGHPIDFSNNLIPGYEFAPVLRSIESDAKKNKYQLNIDWTCAKSIEDPVKKVRITAHINTDTSKIMEMLNNKSVKELQLCDTFDSANDLKGIPYVVYLSPEEELKALNATYFDKDNGLEFYWDEETAYYDPLFNGAVDVEANTREPDKFHYTVDALSLIRSGMNVRVKGTDYTIRLTDHYSLPTLVGAYYSDYNELHPLLRTFLNNCRLAANVTMDKHGHNVTIEPFAAYTNSAYQQAQTADKIQRVQHFEPQNYGQFTTSPSLYFSLCESYNSIKNSFSWYLENKYESSELDDARGALVEMSLSYGMVMFFNGLCVISLIAAWKNGITNWIFKTLIALSSIEMIVENTMYWWWYNGKYKKVLRYANDNHKLNTKETGKKFLETLSKDSEDLTIALTDDSGILNAETYEKGLDIYKNMDFEQFVSVVKPAMDKYKNIKEFQEAQDYAKEIRDLHLTAEEYKRDMKKFGPGSPYVTAFDIASIAFVLIDSVMLILSVVAIIDGPEVADGAQELPGQHREETDTLNRSIERTQGQNDNRIRGEGNIEPNTRGQQPPHINEPHAMNEQQALTNGSTDPRPAEERMQEQIGDDVPEVQPGPEPGPTAETAEEYFNKTWAQDPKKHYNIEKDPAGQRSRDALLYGQEVDEPGGVTRNDYVSHSFRTHDGYTISGQHGDSSRYSVFKGRFLSNAKDKVGSGTHFDPSKPQWGGAGGDFAPKAKTWMDYKIWQLHENPKGAKMLTEFYEYDFMADPELAKAFQGTGKKVSMENIDQFLFDLDKNPTANQKLIKRASDAFVRGASRYWYTFAKELDDATHITFEAIRVPKEFAKPEA